MQVNDYSNSPQFGMALRLENLCKNGKSQVSKCFPANHHYTELRKSSIPQVDNPYDVVVSLLKDGSRKIVAKVLKPAGQNNASQEVLATIYPRKSLLSRADENMSVIKRACGKANGFNSVV